MAIVVGTEVTDRIAGYKGIATSRGEFLHGCVKIVVHPTTLDANGERRKPEVFDEAQLIENDPATTPPPHPLLGTKQEARISRYKGTVKIYQTYLYAGPRVTLQADGLGKDGLPILEMDFDVAELKSYKAPKIADKIADKAKKEPTTYGPATMAGGDRVVRPDRMATR